MLAASCSITNMKTRPQAKSDWVLKISAIVFGLVLTLLPVHAFLSTWGGTAIGPMHIWKSWKEILLGAIIPLVVLYCIQHKDTARKVWNSWLTTLILAYTLLTLAYTMGSQASPDAVLAGVVMNLRFFAIFILGYLLWASGHPWVEQIKRRLPTGLFIVTIGISVLALAQVTVISRDFLTQFGYSPGTIPAFLMVDENPEALRAFATMRGPNPLGAWLLLPLALAAVTVMRQSRNILAGAALGLGLCGLIASGSRSAWLGALVGAIVLAAALVPRDKLKRAVKIGLIPVLALGGIFLILATNVPALRLAVFRSSPDDPYLLEGSTEKHWQETANGLADAALHPFGQGAGTAGPASFYNQNATPKIAENYFVQIAQEIGWLGLILFVGISCMVVFHLWKRRHSTMHAALLASFVAINVINIFLHGWSDDPTSMTWWAIAGLYLFADSKKP